MAQITGRLVVRDDGRWSKFWRDVATWGELSKREASLVLNAAERGLAQNWEQQSAPDGQPWAELATFTQQERQKLGFPAKRPILIRSKDLMLSFTSRQHPRHIADAAAFNGSTVMVVGARENPQTPRRIMLLNWGGRNARGYVPARPFLGLSNKAQEQVGGQAERVLFARVERLGR